MRKTKLSRMKIRPVANWRSAHKFGSVQIGVLLAVKYALLSEILPLMIDHWGELSPYILKFFPDQDQAIGPFIGALLVVAARLFKVERLEA